MALTPVAAPPAERPRFGLLASVDPNPDNNQVRWQGGIAYTPEGCVEGETYAICTDEPVENTFDDRPDIVSWYPYFLTVTEKCSTFGQPTDDDLEEVSARARRLLSQDEERQIGEELWTGARAQADDIPGTTDPYPNIWLAKNPDVDILTHSGAVGFVHALACLEDYLATTNGGRQGMIHATAQLVTHWESFRLLRREGNRILTFKDTIIVPSPGYPGTSPDGAVGDNNVWAYATDKIRVWLGDVTVSATRGSYQEEARRNTTYVQAFRPALAEWEGCRHAGVRVAMSVCDVGGS